MYESTKVQIKQYIGQYSFIYANKHFYNSIK